MGLGDPLRHLNHLGHLLLLDLVNLVGPADPLRLLLRQLHLHQQDPVGLDHPGLP